MGIGAVKKHAKTEWSQSKYEPVLVITLTFFQPRSSSITNRASADAEVTPVTMSLSENQANTSSTSCSTVSFSQVSSSSTATSLDPMPSLFKPASNRKSEIWAVYCISHGYSDNST